MRNSYCPNVLGIIYKIAAGGHRKLYDMNILRKTRLGKAVIGVGNLSFGGSGKTLVAKAIAEHLVDRGLKAGIVCRSYGAAPGPHVLNGDADPYEVGDEAAMLADQGFVVASGRDKTGAAIRLTERMPAIDVIVMDDAFQHHKIHQDLKILIWPKGGAWLREFRSAARHADILLVPNGEQSPRAETETVYFVKETVGLEKTGEGVEKSGEGLEKFGEILAVGGLGPETDFFDQARKTRPDARELRLPDHADYRRPEIQARLEQACRGCEAIVTTAKDAVKLGRLAIGLPPIYVVQVRVKFLTNEEMLWKKIDNAIDTGSRQ